MAQHGAMGTLQAVVIILLVSAGVGPPSAQGASRHDAGLAIEEAWPLIAVIGFVVPLLAALEIARHRRR